MDGQVVQERRMFCFIVDDVRFEVDRPKVTGGEIMDRAGIPREVGLIQVFEDETQRVVGEDETINLAAFHGKFKRCPQFVRG